jgi:predicted dithiol-disulfide oxidoreductase (DUF899 family)
MERRMSDHPVVTLDAWLAARRSLLAEEKELTRLRDALSRKRRDLPWVKIVKDYRFDGPEGENLALGDLFGKRRQLIVYHFMFAPEWENPCKSCSFWADGYNGVTAHLEARDTRLVAVSRAPRAKLEATAKRMGWTFPWYSSDDGDFNYAFDVSFRPEFLMGEGALRYNFAAFEPKTTDLPGISAFVKEADGSVCRTYSAYARGLDALNPAYQLLDITALGRHEEDLPWPMAWVRLRDEYGR